MHGFGGAGGMSDGKYNITNNFGGDLYTFTGKEKAIELMQYVDKINLEMGGQDAKLYSTTSSDIKAMALKYDLHLLDAQVRHLGTDRNMQILQNIYDFVKDKIDIKFYESVQGITGKENDFTVITDKDEYHCSNAVVAAGRSGSNGYLRYATTLVSKDGQTELISAFVLRYLRLFLSISQARYTKAR